ncbi:cupin domain-containing protein [bacterium]|nr:cupin domain-containing protein [bacterium]
MKILNYKSMEAEPVTMEGSKDASVRWLIAREDGAPNFAMRLFEVEPGGYTPLHNHDNEHEIFILEGEGVVWKGGNEVAVNAGTAIFVPPQEKHQFINNSQSVLKFLCLVPV